MERWTEREDAYNVAPVINFEYSNFESTIAAYRKIDAAYRGSPSASSGLSMALDGIFAQLDALSECPNVAAQAVHSLIASDRIADRTLACQIFLAPYYRPSSDPSIVSATHQEQLAAFALLPKSWARAVSEKLNTLARLPIGWDGPGSTPPDRMHVAKLVQTLVDLDAFKAPAPQLVPLASGGIQAEWLLGGRTIEVGITHSGETFAATPSASGEADVAIDGVSSLSEEEFAGLRRALLSFTHSSHGK